jgi:hypothetical protein
LLLLLAAPAVFAQADEPARQVLDDCVEAIDHDVVGMAAIEAACPGLEAALADLGLASFLSEQQREVIGLQGLMNLQSVVRRYRDAPEAAAVEVDSLQTVLDSLQKPVEAQKPLTWFGRFKRWLRDQLSDDAQTSADSWLARWLSERNLPPQLGAWLVYAVLLLVVVLAIVVIVNEVRVARRARRKASGKQASDELPGADGKIASGMTDIDAAAAADRPSLVLRMLVATLVKTGRLRTERSLTHRELTATAKFDAVEQRECFQRVADLAERVVYGGNTVPTDDLEYVVQAGRTLNSQLSRAAT